ncbi:hypothetical protein Bca101_054216 [Brassica carinata]
MSSSETTRSPLVAKDDEIPQNLGDGDVVHEQEESLEQNSTEENVSDNEEAASAVNPLPSEAAQILPMLHNLLLNNDIHRIAREADLASQVHFLEQSVQKLEEEVENLKKLNAQVRIAKQSRILIVLQWILVKGFTGSVAASERHDSKAMSGRFCAHSLTSKVGAHEKRTCSRSLTSSRPVCMAEFKRLGNVKQQSLVKSLQTEIETTHYKHRDEEKLEKQLQAWRNNPSWIDQPPKVQESISRKVLMEEGPMQTVEVKQAAAWTFLWWAGTFPVHLIVQENRKNLTSKYKQEKTMFMKVFEGCWRVEPLFIDEHLCDRMKPKTLQDYDSCSNGRGRIGSKVTMDQMFQPSAILTPPPLSWYIRGITIKTTESMIEDLLAEAARIRGGGGGAQDDNDEGENGVVLEKSKDEHIKERWRSRRRSNGMRYTNRRMM